MNIFSIRKLLRLRRGTVHMVQTTSKTYSDERCVIEYSWRQKTVYRAPARDVTNDVTGWCYHQPTGRGSGS